MNTIILFGIPGGMEWIIILFVVLLLFGGKKIPELMTVEDEIKRGIKEAEEAEPLKSKEQIEKEA